MNDRSPFWFLLGAALLWLAAVILATSCGGGCPARAQNPGPVESGNKSCPRGR